MYITEIKIEDVAIKLFLRFSSVRQLEQKVRKQWPGLTLPKFSKKFMNSHNPKIIEERRLEIEKFLQILLACEEMKSGGEHFLGMLQLPANFYELPILHRKMVMS